MNRTQQLLMVVGMSLLWVSSTMAAPREGVVPAGKSAGSTYRVQVEEVLEIYGLTKQMELIPPLVLTQEGRKKGEPHATVNEILTDSYRSEALYAHVVRHFETHAEPVKLEEALAWLNSPLAKKMTQFELEAATPEGQEKMVDLAIGLESNPPSEARVGLVNRLDKAIRASDLLLDMLISVTLAELEGAQSVEQPEKKVSQGDLEATAEFLKKDVKANVKSKMQVALLYTYRSATDKELERYVGHWESENGQWLIRATNEAWSEAMAAARREAGVRIAEINSKKSTSGL